LEHHPSLGHLGNCQEELSVSLQLWGKGQIHLEHHREHSGSHQEELLVNLQLWGRNRIHLGHQYQYLDQRHNSEVVEHLANLLR
jgi:hypothetical protein